MQEITPENLTELENYYRKTVFILAVPILITTILTIVLPLIFWLLPSQTTASTSLETLRTLWFILIFIAAGTFFLRRMFFRWDRLRDIALLKGVRGLLRTLQSNAIILVILAETVFIIGLLIALWSGEFFDVLRAGLVALILLAINFPRKSVWEKIVTNLQEI